MYKGDKSRREKTKAIQFPSMNKDFEMLMTLLWTATILIFVQINFCILQLLAGCCQISIHFCISICSMTLVWLLPWYMSCLVWRWSLCSCSSLWQLVWISLTEVHPHGCHHIDQRKLSHMSHLPPASPTRIGSPMTWWLPAGYYRPNLHFGHRACTM
jgi:hypothetical protein